MKIINNKKDAIQELKRISSRTNSENNNNINAIVEEILQEVKFPKPDISVYKKLPNPASRYAVVGVFLARRNCQVRVAITGAAPSVFRAAELESRLAESFSVDAIENVTLENELMNDDMHASAAYRASLCVVMTKRAVADVLKIS